MNNFEVWFRDIFGDGLLASIVMAAIIIIITALIAHYAVKLINRLASVDGAPIPSGSILVNIVRVAVWAIGISVALSTCFGVDVNGIIAALGVGGIALSLGLQDTIKNLIGGLQVTIMKIVNPGDHVVIGATEGIVQDVSWRQTVVKDFDNNIHLIPNAVINSTEVQKISPEFLVVTMISLTNDCRDIESLLPRMELLAKQAIEEVAELEKDPWILLTQIGEYGTWAKLRFQLKDVSHAREARDAALRAIAPYTRNDATDMLALNGAEE